MSEFVEIGGGILRVKDIRAAVPAFENKTLIKFNDGTLSLDTFDEPYESVRDKLLGKTSPVVDLRAKFADQLVAYFRGKGQHILAQEVATFYNSMMLSETEGAG